MTTQPVLTTERLILRPFTLDDAPEVQRLAGDYEIALNTLMIPHPYPAGAAEEWIASTAPKFENRQSATFALTVRDNGAFAGAMGLVFKEYDRAEIGYWIGKPFWNHGYTSEAGRAVVAWGFRECALHRIEAFHFVRNPASGRVLQKIGLRHEGTLRGAVKKWDEYLDVEMYGVVRKDWEESVNF